MAETISLQTNSTSIQILETPDWIVDSRLYVSTAISVTLSLPEHLRTSRSVTHTRTRGHNSTETRGMPFYCSRGDVQRECFTPRAAAEPRNSSDSWKLFDQPYVVSNLFITTQPHGNRASTHAQQPSSKCTQVIVWLARATSPGPESSNFIEIALSRVIPRNDCPPVGETSRRGSFLTRERSCE